MLARLFVLLGGVAFFAFALSACSSLSQSSDDQSGASGEQNGSSGTLSSGDPQLDGGTVSTPDDGPGAGPIAVDEFDNLPPIDWTAIRPVVLADDQSGNTLSVTEFGAVPNDGLPDHEAFQAALDNAGRNGVVNVPAGTYDLNQTVRIPSRVVLKGEGLASTVLAFDLGGSEGDLIAITGQPASGWVGIGTDVTAGSTGLSLSGPLEVEIAQGDIIEIEQDNVAEMFTQAEWDVDWADGSVGELAEVVSYDGTTIQIDHPLLSSYSIDRGARVRVIDAARFSGVANLKIQRDDTGYGSSIRLSHAADVWVDGVESELTTKAHIEADLVYRCQIRNNVLHNAHDFGDGGRAYGVSVQRHTTGCLVENNTLYDNRHALIIQLGASGNVFAYNHARGSAGYEDRQPRADISLHGHWPQANLFEGNVVDRVVFADWWGPSGPANTLHRNCVLDSVAVTDQSNDQFLIGNIIGDAGLSIDEGISGTTEVANRIQGTPVNTAASPPSLYRSEQPMFLSDFAWPVVAPESGNGSDREAACRIPAGERSPLGYD